MTFMASGRDECVVCTCMNHVVLVIRSENLLLGVS